MLVPFIVGVVAGYLGHLELRPDGAVSSRVVFFDGEPAPIADNPDAPEALYFVGESFRGAKVSIPAEFVRSVRPAVANAIGQLV